MRRWVGGGGGGVGGVEELSMCIFFLCQSLTKTIFCFPIHSLYKYLAYSFKARANGRNKSQHCWAQQCWELLALVAWCMQTNATTATNIVDVRSLFWP